MFDTKNMRDDAAGSGPTGVRSHIGDNGRDSESSHDGEVDSVRSGAEEAGLDRFPTHRSMGGTDAVMEPINSIVQIPEDYYNRYSPARKATVVVLVSYCAFLAPMSSTSVLAATPEVAREYGTSGSIINLVNALYMLCMGLSPMFWGPLSQVYGRRTVSGCHSISSYYSPSSSL